MINNDSKIYINYNLNYYDIFQKKLDSYSIVYNINYMIFEFIHSLRKHPYISKDIEFSFFTYPVEHIVINNLFKDEIYNSACEFISNQDKNRINAYNLNSNKNGLDFLINTIWKDFWGLIFNIKLNKNIYNHFNIQTPGTNHENSHRDLQICSGLNLPEDKSYYCVYEDDKKNSQPYTKKIVKSIAGLYYLNNDTDGCECQGGGLAFYKFNDEVIKIIPPINNSYIVFQIGKYSFHGLRSSNFRMSYFQQWFHEDLHDFVNRTQIINFERHSDDKDPMCDIPKSGREES